MVFIRNSASQSRCPCWYLYCVVTKYIFVWVFYSHALTLCVCLQWQMYTVTKWFRTHNKLFEWLFICMPCCWLLNVTVMMILWWSEHESCLTLSAGLNSSCTVIVKVLDENNNPPIFSQHEVCVLLCVYVYERYC